MAGNVEDHFIVGSFAGMVGVLAVTGACLANPDLAKAENFAITGTLPLATAVAGVVGAGLTDNWRNRKKNNEGPTPPPSIG